MKNMKISKANKNLIKKITRISKKKLAAFAIAGIIGAGHIVASDAVHDYKVKDIPQNKYGQEDITPLYSYKVSENEFVILDIGNHKHSSSLFDEEKIKQCNKEDISVGIVISPEATREDEIYDDVEYVKGLIKKYNIDFPVYLNIDDIIEDSSLNLEMKEKIMKDFLEKCSANHIYVGIKGTDTNLCRFEKYFNIKGYDAYLTMDDKEIKYTGTCNLVKDLDGNLTSKENFEEIINSRNLNTKEGFSEDTICTVKTEEELIDLSLRTGMSENEILEFNDAKTGYLEEGLNLRIPSSIETSNKGPLEVVYLEDPIIGCDISYAQKGNTDWEKVANNFEFVILRSNQGKNLDDCFEENAKNCNIYGIPFGVYCYNDYSLLNCDDISQFTKTQEDQADFTLKALKNKKVDFPVYLDIETPSGVELKDYLSKEYVKSMLDIWKEKVTQSSYIPGVYCNSSTYEYLKSCYPNIEENFEIWVAGGDQYTSSKKDIPFEKVKPSKVLEKEDVHMAQSTDSAVGAGSGNSKGHLDIDFSAVNYKSVVPNNTQIKEFHPIPDILYFAKLAEKGAIGAVGIGSIIILTRIKRRKTRKGKYKESMHQKPRTR